MEGESTPLMGATTPCNSVAASSMSPASIRVAAAPWSPAQPSSMAARATWPRMAGPSRCQSHGGPQCRIRRASMPGTRSVARPASTSCGLLASSAASARRLPSSTRSSAYARVSSATSPRSPPAGGDQSTTSGSTPCARRLSSTRGASMTAMASAMCVIVGGAPAPDDQVTRKAMPMAMPRMMMPARNTDSRTCCTVRPPSHPPPHAPTPIRTATSQ